MVSPTPTRSKTVILALACAAQFMVVLGAGDRLFGETSDKKPMRLARTQIVEGDVAFLTYECVRDA